MKRKPLPLLDVSRNGLLAAAVGGPWERVAPVLSSLRLGENEYLQLALVGSREDLLSHLQSPRAPAGLRFLQGGNAGGLFFYSRAISDRKFAGQFALFRTALPAIYLVMFVSARTYWRMAISPLIESLYPKVAAPFLTQLELYEILKQVQKAQAATGIRILELSARKRLRGEARKRFQSTREWTDEGVESVFREARQANQWFQSVTFEIVNRREDGRLYATSKGIISKYGYLACNDDFDLYTTIVANRLMEIAGTRLEFFSNRDRVSTSDHIPKPVTIDYENDILARIDETRRLSDALKRFKYGSCSVLHSNPYLHVSVVDNKDYSTVEVWVLSPKQILIVPQVRTSENALKRIVNHIFENFREGTISGFPQPV